MKYINLTRLVVLSFILFMSCNDSQKTKDKSDLQSNLLSESATNFSATLNNKDYQLKVNCSYLDEDYFQFKSDKLDNKDTNGDGIVISGFQNGKKLAFTIIDNGSVYSTPKLGVWSKSKNKVMGGGYLYVEGSTDRHEVEFELNCN